LVFNLDLDSFKTLTLIINEMNTILRVANPEDSETSGLICFEAFARISNNHNFPLDFTSVDQTKGLLSHLISREDAYTVIAEIDGKIVGSNVLWENGEIAGVGPITVDPSIQNGSIGKVLMKNVLNRAKTKGFESVRLVQAAFNNLSLALYSKLGFDVQEPLSVMNGPVLNLTIPGYEVRLANIQDMDACNNLCDKIHDHHRQGDIGDSINQNTATVVIRDGRITGYATLIGFFGHAVAETNEDLKALIGAAKEFAGPGMLLPTRNGELMRWCLENGLKIVQPMSLMSYGTYNIPKGAFMPSIIY
jgi:predicted N-acetyltransferase YhbS